MHNLYLPVGDVVVVGTDVVVVVLGVTGVAVNKMYKTLTHDQLLKEYGQTNIYMDLLIAYNV